ncbi:BrnA antitoxin family protein [Sulfitobacter sp. F26169L]|uniref:BrnA antitoxin family protein n=1 Tax=Sulfitobacter sp. F26169L TaxID=2996015 RepID=UPI0022608FA7|nr:BrnA antitoxin family protein [Sulfitobacter sp. F26169L]MCX7568315.1 BrnA antitoxin family protein [Sulfitobacter sp. F26169L]
MSNIKTASLDELRAMKERGELLPPKENTTKIDMPDGFWDDAEIVSRPSKTSVHLRVNTEILEFFKEDGKGHLTRMNAVLQSYVDAKKNRYTPS